MPAIKLPKTVEILIKYNLDMKWFLHNYLEYKFPNRKILDAYETIYKQWIEFGKAIAPAEPCIIISPTLIVCEKEDCKGYTLTSDKKSNDYMAIVITQPGDTKIDVCTYDDKKIAKIFYKNEYIVKTRATKNLINDNNKPFDITDKKYEFNSVAELIYHISIVDII